MQPNFFTGTVVGIDVNRTFSTGQNVPVILVRSEDGSPVSLPWLPTGTKQEMPINGQEVLYYTTDGANFRIAAIHGKNPDYIRKGRFGLNQGEAVWQGDAGQGYVKTSEDGSMDVVSGGAVSSIHMDDDGIEIQAPSISLKGYANCVLQLNEDGSITLGTIDTNGNVIGGITRDANGNYSIVAKTFSVKADNILLDGNVSYGPGATDPTTAAEFGMVVTAGPGGTYPFDLLSGAPIPGSKTVKAAS